MEERVTYTSDGIVIEGLLHRISAKGVVVTHPHPLYGGDMYNPVVETLVRTFQNNGFSTLRFNFRGVGGSQGSHDYGSGEGRDVINALSFCSAKGISEISLAGYSFGAWVNAGVSSKAAPLAAMFMVSPPVAFTDFSSVKQMPTLKLVVSGSRDEIAPVGAIQKMLPAWNTNASLEIIHGADHFYAGYLDALGAALDAHIRFP